MMTWWIHRILALNKKKMHKVKKNKFRLGFSFCVQHCPDEWEVVQLVVFGYWL